MIHLNLTVSTYYQSKFDNVHGKDARSYSGRNYAKMFIWITMDTTLLKKVLRCKQIVADGMLNEYQFTKEQQDDVMDFMVENKDKMREISLRMAIQTCRFKKLAG